MKRHKIKLALNSQTIRHMQVSGLKDVHGGLMKNQSVEVCRTDDCTAGCNPTAGCRACG